jgi:hypothetical protein
VRVITIIDRPSIEVIDGKSSIRRVLEYRWRRLLSGSLPKTAALSCDDPGSPHQRSIQGMSRPRRWQRSIAARCRGSFVAAAQSSSWLPWLWQLWQKKRPIATFTENERRPRLDVGSCNGQLPYHCAPDRFEGWNPSRLRTCSIEISVRTLLKSTPGMVVPDSATRRLGALWTVPFPFLSMGNGNGPPLLFSRVAANPQACGGPGRLAPVTLVTRPTARS